MEPDATLLLSLGALIIGMLFGVMVQRSRFCMVAAVSNILLLRDFRQLHGYFAALAIALLGTLWLEQGGWVSVADSRYRSAQLDWLGSVCGGLLFGFGAVLAGGCIGLPEFLWGYRSCSPLYSRNHCNR